MATQRITSLEDDIDGSEAKETVTFAVDGVSYEIDLNDSHAAEIRAALRPYIEAGRKTSTGRGRARAERSKAHHSIAHVRAWAKERGMPVSDRGRVQADIVRKYETAN
ncbi:Lsr2 family protein [Arthrobacter sp. ISL-72]|uniref:histone-like nucleoid-structuring protein Lsr2 n=1 Tax=Arthrobacter sp. ISL-72 TaxID=2819114 RepID=UPI001BE72B1C|nr:Lsr2 family protein [Arthrobacter sp. ISL-72]MBT2597224.1 Lsr2 family protein [Arthrobacter sp. ISL-72]